MSVSAPKPRPPRITPRAAQLAAVYTAVDDWLGRFVGRMARDQESGTYYWRMRVTSPALSPAARRQLDNALEAHGYWFETQPHGAYVCRTIECDMLRAFIAWQQALPTEQREQLAQGSVEACLYTFLGSNTSETAVKTKSHPFK